MSLSERLAEAAGQRTGAADLVLTENEPLLEEDALPSGVPASCPECGSPGYLEHIDLRHSVQHERCRPCGARWIRPV